MQIQSQGLVAAVGEWGPFKDGTTIPYIDWLDAAGGVYRATLPAGIEKPVALARGSAVLDLVRKDDGKLTLRVVKLDVRADQLAKAA